MESQDLSPDRGGVCDFGDEVIVSMRVLAYGFQNKVI